jgi:glycerophosphoryl diester phosphodiesterase
MRDWQSYRGPLLFAHRGASAQLPENSLPAFRRALDLGADVLETDLQVTSDGYFVLSHDASGVRIAGVNKAINGCTLGEIRGWDIGHGFIDSTGARPFIGQAIRVPTLDEVLKEFPDSLLNVDVKQASPRDLPRLLELIGNHRATLRVLLASFSEKTLRQIRALGYPGPTGMSRPEVARLALLPSALNRILGVNGTRVQVAPRHLFKSFANREFIEKSHRLGLAVDFWVINQPDPAEALLELGADGVMTDDPDVMSELFRISPHTAHWRQRH